MKMKPMYSVLSSTTGYDASNRSASPNLFSQYCNGPRVPPEIANGSTLCAVPTGQTGNGTPGCVPPGAVGLSVPPGIPDINPTYVAFSVTPTATVDEGNNWINLFFGPLSTVNASTAQTAVGYNAPLLDPHLGSGSSAVNRVPSMAAESSVIPVATRQLLATDFYGNARPTFASFDSGAVQHGFGAVANVTGGPLVFGSVPVGSTSQSRTLTLHNTGNASVTGIRLVFSSPRFSRPFGGAGGSCTTTLAAGANCTINVVFSPNAAAGFGGTLSINASVPVAGSPVSLSGSGRAVAPARVSITPNPLTITLPTGINVGTGTVRLTNTAPTGSASAMITAVNVAGGSPASWFFDLAPGGNHCQGATLAPGAFCTVGVRFNNGTATRGANRAGTITFTDNATGSPQTGNLVGHAN